jgi:hypothetical protein
MPELTRGRVFALLVVACAAAAGAYVFAASRSPAAPPRVAVQPVATPVRSVAVEATNARTNALLGAVSSRRIVFRDLDRHDVANFGKIAVGTAGDPTTRRIVEGLKCDRVYFSAGHGLCLASGGGFGRLFSARFLDSRFNTVKTVTLTGIPSRARISHDGKLGSTTTFVSGDSYAAPGKFSTRTTLWNMATGTAIVDLEQFHVTKAGQRFDAPDFNFWGVTFARDDRTFYATLASQHKTYLIKGDIAHRTARVIHENVECPSLSPDGTRIAFKKLVATVPGSPAVWHLYVLDLRTMREHALAEPNVIDDQVEWLGDDLVTYRLGEEVWVVPADGSGASQRLLAQADSPAVLS